jgi:3-isopropylmalate/(R)-2-methylmalate dehydratase small subunit
LIIGILDLSFGQDVIMLKGRAYKFSDDINTDVIYPGKYLSVTTDRQEMAKHCFETVHPDFLKNAKPGDIIVAGKNFGCGSSREQAAACLKYFGISIILAESFARIFFRNAINLGLPVLVVPDITQRVDHHDTLEIDIKNAIIKNTKTGEEYQAVKLPPFILGIINAGGLIPYLQNKYAGQK